MFLRSGPPIFKASLISPTSTLEEVSFFIPEEVVTVALLMNSPVFLTAA